MDSPITPDVHDDELSDNDPEEHHNEDSDEEQEEANDDELKDLANEKILKQGYLLKRSRRRMGGWKKRWVVLRRSRLCLYKDDNEYTALKIVKMTDCSAQQVNRPKYKERVLKITTPKRKFYFKAATPDEMHDWVGAVNSGLAIKNPQAAMAGDVKEDDEDEVDVVPLSSPQLKVRHLHKHLVDDNHDTSESDYDSDSGKITTAESTTKPSLPEVTSNVVKSGYLRKQGQVRKSRWKTRWFVLRKTGQLVYYKNDKEYELLHIIKLRECTEIGRLEQAKKDFSFQIIHPKRAFTICASNEEDLTDWLTALQTEFSKTGAGKTAAENDQDPKSD